MSESLSANTVDSAPVTKVPDLVIYHGGCPDGIAGAWCFLDIVPHDYKYHPGTFGGTPPDVTDKFVFFVDFVYAKPQMREICSKASMVCVLDHHKSSDFLLDLINEFSDKLYVTLDMNRSGCQLAWDYVRGGARPWQIDHIADRDLWRWKFDNSKNTTRAMLGMGFYTSIDRFCEVFALDEDMATAVGHLFLVDDERMYSKLTSSATDCVVHSQVEPGVKWLARVVMCDHTYASEVGSRLVSDGKCDFAALVRYDLRSDEWWISLRASPDSSIDLTDVVKHFSNGGGHAKAAGFTIYGNTLKTVFHPII